MPTLSHPGFKDSSLALQSAVDACAAADTKQSLAHPALRPGEGVNLTREVAGTEHFTVEQMSRETYGGRANEFGARV
jgi:hypothetical protein